MDSDEEENVGRIISHHCVSLGSRSWYIGIGRTGYILGLLSRSRRVYSPYTGWYVLPNHPHIFVICNIGSGPYNAAVETGAHSHIFAERIGKTHFLGLRLPPGNVWQAKESILQNIIKQAQETLQEYKDPAVGVPDPSFVLQLTDDVYTGSNLYAVQKNFQGEFSFDIFFESGSSKQKLSCKLFCV